MKKQIIVLLMMMTGLISIANAANSSALSKDSIGDKFIGVWDMVFKDLPDGDWECQLVLKNVDGELKGELTSQEVINKYGKGIEVYDLEIDGEELSCMYTAEGYDVSIVVEMVDEKTLEGYMMDMFEVFATKSDKK